MVASKQQNTYIQQYAINKNENRNKDRGVPHFKAPAGGDPHANIRINVTSPETRGIVLPDAKNRTIVSS